jgi:hypothetical protein
VSAHINLIDAQTDFGCAIGQNYTKHTQEIPRDFLDSLQSERLASAAIRAGELHRVASVPTAVVEIWQRQGLDFHKMTAREIVAKLHKDGLDSFITTNKRI